MYAVFRTGGKQYRASKGDRLRIERLAGNEGDSVEFDQVLLVGEGAQVKLGTPLVSGSKVKAKVTAQGTGFLDNGFHTITDAGWHAGLARHVLE